MGAPIFCCIGGTADGAVGAFGKFNGGVVGADILGTISSFLGCDVVGWVAL